VKRHLKNYNPIALAEARMALSWLGRSTAEELHGAELVAFAANTREGRPTDALRAELAKARS
jgi:hypothetical protein